jgi:hypothetical protein
MRSDSRGCCRCSRPCECGQRRGRSFLRRSGACGSDGNSGRRSGRFLARRACGRILGLLFSRSGSFGSSVGFRLPLNGATHFFGDVHGDGAGVSFFLRDAEAGEKVDNGLRFDFEFAGQLVNSDLIGVGHAFRLDHLLP